MVRLLLVAVGAIAIVSIVSACATDRLQTSDGRSFGVSILNNIETRSEEDLRFACDLAEESLTMGDEVGDWELLRGVCEKAMDGEWEEAREDIGRLLNLEAF